MDDLIQLMKHNLVISRNQYLLHDIEYLLWCFENNIPNMDPCIYKVRRNMYESYHKMYEEILNILREKNQIENVLEMMPLIDDYLEYFFLMTLSKYFCIMSAFTLYKLIFAICNIIFVE